MYRIGSPARLLTTLALALVALAVPARSFAQAPTFNALVTTPKGGEPWFQPAWAAAGDFNGDGKLDSIVTDGSYVSDVRLMLGNGNGAFTQINVNVSATPTNPTPGMIKAAYLNGDARLDAVFVSPQGNLAPTVLINTGNDVNGVPQFTVTTYTPVYSGLRSVTVGDLNGDGSPDFIVGNAYGNLYVYLNNGDGTFTAGQTTNLMPNVGGSTGPGVIADVNGDGKADFVVTSNQAGATDIFFGNGNGTLQAPVVIPNSTTSIAVADVNGDGKLDLLAVANGAPNQLLVYLNTGGGSFSAPTEYSTGGTAFHGWTSVTTADINGDGKLDVVTTNSGSNNVAAFLGDGSGTFGAPALFTVNVNPFDVAVRDFNGDGKPDIATVGYGDRSYGVLTNTTVFAPPVTTVFASGTATVTTWDPIFPAVAYPNWPSQCSAAPSVGPNANWVNAHPAFAFPLGSHPWEGIAPFNFAANWINAWENLSSRGPIGSDGGQSWTKYSTPVTGEGDFVVQFLADNCSWIYLDDQLIGVQDTGLFSNGTGRYPLTLTGAGEHTLSFIIFDGGGAAGGKFRLETRQSFIDGGGDPGGLTPPKAPSTTTVSFGVGPFVYTGVAFTATESVSPSGVATIAYSGDCTNAGSTCTATATYAGDVTHLGSFDTASITIDKAPSVTTVSFGAASYVYTGSVIQATASAGATIGYSGSCTNVGTCTAKATTAGDANHLGSDAGANAEITKADATVVVTPYDVEYDGQPHTATVTSITGVNGETGATVGAVTLSTTHTNVGTYSTDSWSFTGAANYNDIAATVITNTIKDTTAPVITSLSTNAPTLWPPNHKMVAVTVSALATDLVGVSSLKIISATSSEPDNGLGDGDTAGDIQVTGDLTLNLRAERSGKGNGRTYTITVEARDAAGNPSTKTCTVFVPKSQGGR